jgi:monoamine oxidase
MARTPLLDGLQRAAARAAADSGASAPEGASTPGTTRRTFLARSGALTAGAMAAGWPVQAARAAGGPRIVVVGAGLAGLTATYRLQQAGYSPQLYEASDRAGGRCWTIRGQFDDGQIAEHGGELIDNGHLEMKHLAQELGFDLDNLVQSEANGTETVGYFDGQPYTWAQASADLQVLWQQIHKDTSAASYPTTYKISTLRGQQLDQMSIAEYLATYCPGGSSSKLAQLLDVAYNIEYGAECTQQSALNMLYLLGYQGPGNMRIFGKSNEKFHVRGGNDQVPTELAARIGSSALHYASELIAIAQNADGTQKLTFNQGGRTVTVTADHTVIAIPFSILRSSVDFSKAKFNKVKTWAINELGMGTNSKLNVGFKRRIWRDQELNGETYSDAGYQCTWEVSRAQPGDAGILVQYTGGTIGTTFGGGQTPQQLTQRFLPQIEPVIPGITQAWDGHATVDSWKDYRWTKGSYSYWKVGQYTRFSGAESEASGNFHFAGEHTSQDYQGYLNGGVESGQRAANEILATLK